MRTMPKIDLIELKIMLVSIATTMAFNMDVLVRFLAPLLSALTWWFLKPLFDDFRQNRKNKKKK